MKLAEQIEIACLMEATARKPGNVHPMASFHDLCYEDFVKAAHSVAAPLSAARDVGLGSAIFGSVRQTRIATGTNVNLGIVLLLAPLAAVPENVSLQNGIQRVLEQTTVDDAEQVYAAIRLAHPSGMGETSAQDIRGRPTVTLREAMALATDRDRIAEQYVSNFSLVFEARAKLIELLEYQIEWEPAIIWLHLWIMSKWPDTLIARKCGRDTAEQAARRAASVLEIDGEIGKLNRELLSHFDAWLRADGHRRNPGTTADLVAATLFAAFRDGLIEAPSHYDIQDLARRIVAEPEKTSVNDVDANLTNL